MKTYKKLVAGLFLFIGVVSFCLLATHHQASAYVGTTAQQVKDAKFEFVNRGLIKVNIGGTPVNFIDGKPFDKDLKYLAQGYDCNAYIGDSNEMDDIFALENLGNYPGSLNPKFIHIKYDGGGGCKETKLSKSPSGIDVGMRTWFNWIDAGTIEIIDGSRTFTKAGSDASYFLYTGEDGQSCQDKVFVNQVTSRQGDNTPTKSLGNSGKYFELDKDGELEPKDTDARNLPLGDCEITGYNFLNSVSTVEGFNKLFNSYFQIGDAANKTKPAGTGTTTVSPTSVNSTGNSSDCAANSNIGLEWAWCPVTTSISKAVDGVEKLIESQLNFNVDSNLSDKSQIHVAWSLFKNIVSALIVVILLVMVISQAIGGGPFEAYTVKKVLPRLLIAVIAIQLSWEISKWLIILANDTGNGVKQILIAPFGTGGDLDLNSILHRLNPAWALASQAIIPTLLLGGAILAVVTLPGTLVIAFGLFIGVFMALAVLLFRNVLIVALTIFLPVALLAWVLPGTQRLWKFWLDNFIKLLMLFPLLIAIIYTGRIFAWIAADAGKAGFIDYMIVLVAYFGPYFIIFKAYKWGGSMLSAGGMALANTRKGLTKANESWLKTLGERAQGNLADRYNIHSGQQRRARDLVERLKSKNAPQHQIDRAQNLLDRLNKRDRFRRALLKTAAGFPLPTERQQIETLAKASAYKKDLVEKKQGLIHQDYVEELNRNGGDVKGAKQYIRDKYGFDNMVQDSNRRIVTDELGNPQIKDGYTDRAMYNWLVDTRSALELGDLGWRMGEIKDESQAIEASEFMAGGRYAHLNPTGSAKKARELSERSKIVGYKSDPTLTREEIMEGKTPNLDIAKTTGFMGMMNADPQRYAYVAEKLPTLQPFNQELGGGPKRTDYRPAVLDTSGNEARKAVGKTPTDAAPVSASDYMPGGLHGGLNTATTPAEQQARALQLAYEEADRRARLLADDARLLKWQQNMESPRQYAAVRPEEYQIMAKIKSDLEEIGLKSQSAERLHDTLEELSVSKGVEGISIVQQMMGGEQSARGSINSMFGTGYLEGKLNVQLRNPSIQATEHGRIAELPREDALSDEPSRRDFRQVLLADAGRPPKEQRGVAREFAQALAETAGYAQAAHGTQQTMYWQVLQELHESSGGAPLTAGAFNSIIDLVVNNIDDRVERAIRTAAAQNKTPAEVARIAQEARDAADKEKEEYEKMRLGPLPATP